jgi:phenylalanyl-tRNA synthetase beta chain
MKISLNQIKQYTEVHCSDDDLITKIGAQLGGVEEVIPVGKKYEGVVIVKVVRCDDHPNADRLHVCMVDDGGVVQGVERDEQGLVQVVCGAPNVAAGVTVAWLPPGATVPVSYDSDPFVLEARALRGVVSNGMLASPKELSIGDSHEGILLIDEEVQPGTMFADKFGLKGDTVIDIENKMFTHRPDCFGWLGVAREIAGIQGLKFSSPEWYTGPASVTHDGPEQLPLVVRNEIPELVPRFTAITMSDVKVAPSPVWLQVQLARVGIRPINNIVDLTNYYMVLTGQPLHAYDYDKVVAQDAGADRATIIIRKPRDGEKLLLLNGKEIEPRAEAIMIATETKAIGLGGVMGGGDTEVDENTRNIVLECANFDMYSIRRTAMAHGVFTDAVTRFNKGQSPLQTLAVLARIVQDVQRLAGAQVAGNLIDDNHLPEDVRERNAIHPDVMVSAPFINERLGLNLSAEEMAGLLQNVECSVRVEGDDLRIRAPFWRTDIEIPEDVVEEVGRLYGFDKLPLELPQRSIAPAHKDPELALKATVRSRLAQAGANEVLTYTFVHGNLLEKTGQDPAKAFKLGNALSPDLQYYRLSLTPSLLDKVHANVKAGYEEFAIFELGKVHSRTETDEDGLPREFGRIGFVYASAPKKSRLSDSAPYYQALKYLQNLVPGHEADLAFVPLTENRFQEHEMFQQLVRPFEPNRSAYVYLGEMLLGVVGEYRQTAHKALKLPAYTAGFELFLKPFEKIYAAGTEYVPLPRFPKVTQDISLRVASDTPYKSVYDAVSNSLGAGGKDMLISLEPLDIYQSEDDTARKHVTLRLVVASYDRTLTDTEVNAMLDTAAVACRDSLGAERL